MRSLLKSIRQRVKGPNWEIHWEDMTTHKEIWNRTKPILKLSSSGSTRATLLKAILKNQPQRYHHSRALGREDNLQISTVKGTELIINKY
jgi:hypothetical protein